jgi:hypothetical protein
MLESLVKRLMPKNFLPILLASASMSSGLEAQAGTQMTLGNTQNPAPVITTGDYIQNGVGVLEKLWRYSVQNVSTVGDVNNMIEWHLNAGNNNNILDAYVEYDGFIGTVTPYLSATSSGFTGLLPPTFPFDLDQSRANFFIITPADTPSAPGLATATSYGSTFGAPNFNSVAVNVPFLPAQVRVESATQQVEGKTEIRYKITNLGTEVITGVTIPGGRQQGVGEVLAAPGWTAEAGPLATVFAGGALNLGEEALFALRSAQGAGGALLARVEAGGTALAAAVRVPGAAGPRVLAAWTDAGGFHARFLVRPGAVVTGERAAGLAAWTADPAPFAMPWTTNLLQADAPAGAASFFLRLRHDEPVAPESPELLAEPLAGVWLDAGAPEPVAPLGGPALLPQP